MIWDIVHQNLKMMSSKEIEVKFGFHIRNFRILSSQFNGTEIH